MPWPSQRQRLDDNTSTSQRQGRNTMIGMPKCFSGQLRPVGTVTNGAETPQELHVGTPSAFCCALYFNAPAIYSSQHFSISRACEPWFLFAAP